MAAASNEIIWTNRDMNTDFFSEHISPYTNAKVILLFGGNPKRRDEVIMHLMQLHGVNIFGSLSEQEGIDKISELKRVDIVLIGGRYTDEQRMRIRSFVRNNLPNTEITEPGKNYPYSNESILRAIKTILQSKD